MAFSNCLNHGLNGLKDFTDKNLCHLRNQNKSVKVVKLSEFYHSNYTDLKEALIPQVRNLGQKHCSLTQEFKEIFI